MLSGELTPSIIEEELSLDPMRIYENHCMGTYENHCGNLRELMITTGNL